MKKIQIILLLFAANLFAQEDAWIYLNDKPNAANFLANPLSMLSQRALERRVAQNIPLDDKDVPIHQAYIDQISIASGISIMAKSKWLNALHVRGSVENIQALENFSFVNTIEFANKNLNNRPALSKPFFETSINKKLDAEINYNYGNSANQIEMLNGHLLHQQNFLGQGKIIAVLDSGFTGVDVAAPFQELISNNQILGGYNFPDRNSNYFSRHNHGTMVLSCMGGFVDGQLVGTAPKSNYYLFITEDVNSENPVEESYWVEAAELADYYGADIINSSLGYFHYDNPNYNYTYNDMNGTIAFASKGADIAHSKGMIVVVSAGNSGSSSNPHIGVPADATKVLTVGAVTSTETYASFSSIGPSFDGRIKPDVCAKGQSSTVSTITGNITTASGTSFSSPIMAGMVATFWSAIPTLTNNQVVQFIKESSDLFSNPNAQKGYGIPDFQLALTNALNNQTLQLENPFIYPNPVNSEFFLASNITSGKLYIFNKLGQLVKEQPIVSKIQNVSIENLQSGIYVYLVESPIQSFSGKIIKN